MKLLGQVRTIQSRNVSNIATIKAKALDMVQKTKAQAKVYMDGIKMLFEETKTAKLLKDKIKHHGYKPNRAEFVFLNRNAGDISKMAPFFLIALIAPEIIPFLVIKGSTFIPSTCISAEQLVT